jgi:hypothetical protein
MEYSVLIGGKMNLTVGQLKELIKGRPDSQPIFVQFENPRTGNLGSWLEPIIDFNILRDVYRQDTPERAIYQEGEGTAFVGENLISLVVKDLG